MEYLFLFVLGGCSYGALEILYRGQTHYTMLLAGGVCMVLIFILDSKLHEKMWKMMIMGGAVITTVEFLTGIIVNMVFNMNVWSYDGLAYNLFGQICPAYTLIWMALTLPAVFICRGVDRFIFKGCGYGVSDADL